MGPGKTGEPHLFSAPVFNPVDTGCRVTAPFVSLLGLRGGCPRLVSPPGAGVGGRPQPQVPALLFSLISLNPPFLTTVFESFSIKADSVRRHPKDCPQNKLGPRELELKHRMTHSPLPGLSVQPPPLAVLPGPSDPSFSLRTWQHPKLTVLCETQGQSSTISCDQSCNKRRTQRSPRLSSGAREGFLEEVVPAPVLMDG